MKLFIDPEKDKTDTGKLKKGVTVIVYGDIEFDTFSRDVSIRPMSIVAVKRKKELIMQRKRELSFICIPICRLWTP